MSINDTGLTDIIIRTLAEKFVVKRSFDAFAKGHGFECEMEFHELVSSRDIDSSKKLRAFRKWQDEDGSKASLMCLPAMARPGEN